MGPRRYQPHQHVPRNPFPPKNVSTYFQKLSACRQDLLDDAQKLIAMDQHIHQSLSWKENFSEKSIAWKRYSTNPLIGLLIIDDHHLKRRLCYDKHKYQANSTVVFINWQVTPYCNFIITTLSGMTVWEHCLQLNSSNSQQQKKKKICFPLYFVNQLYFGQILAVGIIF